MVRRKYILDVFPNTFKVKWPGTVLDEGFVPFPKRLLRAMKDMFVGADAVKQLSIMLAIVDYARPNQERGPSADYLAFQTGLDRAELDAQLQELSQRQWLTVKGPSIALEIDYAKFVRDLEGRTGDAQDINASRRDLKIPPT